MPKSPAATLSQLEKTLPVVFPHHPAALFLAVVLKWRYVSLGSITAALAMPFLLGVAGRSWPFILLSMAMACLIVYRHKDNIKRLREGSEKKIRGG